MSSFDIQALASCFKHPTVKSTFTSMYHCLGTVTAVASSPEMIRPSEWMEQLQADPEIPLKFENELQVKAISGNFIAWWNYCLAQFDSGEKITLPEKVNLTASGNVSKALKDFCMGYLQGYNWLSKSWEIHLPDKNTDESRSVSVLNMILLKLVDEKILNKSEPVLSKELPDIAGCYKTLPSLLSAVGMLGKDLYSNSTLDESIEQLPLPTPHSNATRNVGRNDQCPCGSGKKFKKCCLH